MEREASAAQENNYLNIFCLPYFFKLLVFAMVSSNTEEV